MYYFRKNFLQFVLDCLISQLVLTGRLTEFVWQIRLITCCCFRSNVKPQKAVGQKNHIQQVSDN